MKPHALRKTLWFTNIALALICVAVGAWFFTKVRPASAQITKRPKNDIPAAYVKIQDAYKRERQTGLKWKPEPPVSEADIQKYILIPKFTKTDPVHWIYSGPLPPEKIKTETPAGPVVQKPKGLDTLGKVTTVIYSPPSDTVVLFAFNGSKKSRAFGIGDWVRQESKGKEIYRLTEVKEVGEATYEVRYAVHSGGKEEPDFTGFVPYGKGAVSKDWPGYLRPHVPVKKKAVAPGATPGVVPAEGELASGVPGTPGVGEGVPVEGTATAESGAPGEGEGTEATSAETTAAAENQPEVIEVVRKPVDEITIEDMQPEIEYNPENRSERAIKVDDNTYRFLKSKNAKSIASTVKTEVARDKRTGRTIGMRITGLKDGSAAGALQVKKGDILVSINGRKVESRSAAISIVEGLNPDSVVTVVIDRHGKLLTYKVDPRDPKTRRQIRYFDNLK